MRSVGKIPGFALITSLRDGGQVFGEAQALLDILDGFLSGIAIRFRREFHEPLIELINRGAGVRFPQMWFIGVNGHEVI
jgi:hypothetical protein